MDLDDFISSFGDGDGGYGDFWSWNSPNFWGDLGYDPNSPGVSDPGYGPSVGVSGTNWDWGGDFWRNFMSSQGGGGLADLAKAFGVPSGGGAGSAAGGGGLANFLKMLFGGGGNGGGSLFGNLTNMGIPAMLLGMIPGVMEYLRQDKLGDRYKDYLDNEKYRSMFDPFGAARPGYLQQLMDFEKDPNAYFANHPGFQFDMDQAKQMVMGSAAKSGHLGSGNEAAWLQDRGNAIAHKYRTEEANRLAALAGANISPRDYMGWMQAMMGNWQGSENAKAMALASIFTNPGFGTGIGGGGGGGGGLSGIPWIDDIIASIGNPSQGAPGSPGGWGGAQEPAAPEPFPPNDGGSQEPVSHFMQILPPGSSGATGPITNPVGANVVTTPYNYGSSIHLGAPYPDPDLNYWQLDKVPGAR